jgi:hypothetical protein
VTDPRLDSLLQNALSRLLAAMVMAFDQSGTQLGSLAIAATRNADRQALLDAAYDLQRSSDKVKQAFARELSTLVAQALQTQIPSAHVYADTDWSALRLVDDAEVEQSVSADRLSRDLESQCEGELHELHAYFSTLQEGTAEDQIFPLRPAIVGKALLKAVMQASEAPTARQCLADVISIQAGGALRGCYRQLITDCEEMGVHQAPLTFKRTAGNTTGSGGLGSPIQPPSSGAPASFPGAGQHGGAAQHGSAAPTAQQRAVVQLGRLFGVEAPAPMPQAAFSTGQGDAPSAGASSGTGPSAIAVDQSMLSLMRRLQSLPEQAPASPAYSGMSDSIVGNPPLMNVIRVHREALVEASGGTPLDQMVIDIVAALFDQLLADPDVPPQMARQVGRLQLPVLRVALRDQTFFHARKHPVRKLINRMGSLAAVFDDLGQGAGKQCIDVITTLVNDIVDGDFGEIDLYNDKLTALEAFIETQRQQDTNESADVAALLSDKEADLRVQQRYMHLVGQELNALDAPDELKAFVKEVWTQVQVKASTLHGADSPQALRFKQAGHRLVMSVQPQGHPSLRQAFLRYLPGLMRDLNDGLRLIQWPPESTQAFFDMLLPLHAQAMKAPPAHQLTLRLLEDRLRHVERICIPTRAEAANDPLPQAGSALVDISLDTPLTPEEAQQVGWLSQASVQQDTASLDIDLSAGEDPALAAAEVDILLDGPAPPAAGPSLVNYIQSGAAYRMMLKGHWRKVRLTWVSEGRTFFIFTQGHQGAKQTISLTARTLQTMCESGRFKAFEQAQLLERATIRARRQLAALGTPRKAAA